MTNIKNASRFLCLFAMALLSQGAIAGDYNRKSLTFEMSSSSADFTHYEATTDESYTVPINAQKYTVKGTWPATPFFSVQLRHTRAELENTGNLSVATNTWRSTQLGWLLHRSLNQSFEFGGHVFFSIRGDEEFEMHLNLQYNFDDLTIVEVTSVATQYGSSDLEFSDAGWQLGLEREFKTNLNLGGRLTWYEKSSEASIFVSRYF